MRYALITITSLAAAAAHASISQSTLTPPGGFAQAACYSSTGGLPAAGADIVSFGTPQSAEEHAFSGNSSASATASYSGAPTFNSGAVTASFGAFRFNVQDTTFSFQPFPAAQVNGGWKDTFTVNHPSLNGQAGYMTFEVRAQGTESASGESGSATLLLAAYKDNAILTTNPYFSPGNSDIVSTSAQYGRWGSAAFGVPVSRVVDGVVTFSVPITFGQNFSLGVYALASAGLRSSGGFGSTCTGNADFSTQGVTWNGITTIRDSTGTIINGATIVSGSGVDWIPPYALPCGTADFDGDGDSGTDADIEAFFACLSGNCCPTCYLGGADFNADGDSGTDADIESFFRVLGGAPC